MQHAPVVGVVQPRRHRPSELGDRRQVDQLIIERALSEVPVQGHPLDELRCNEGQRSVEVRRDRADDGIVLERFERSELPREAFGDPRVAAIRAMQELDGYEMLRRHIAGAPHAGMATLSEHVLEDEPVADHHAGLGLLRLHGRSPPIMTESADR